MSLEYKYIEPLNNDLGKFNNIDILSRELLSILIYKMDKDKVVNKSRQYYFYLENPMYNIVRSCELGLNGEEPILDLNNRNHHYGLEYFIVTNEMKVKFYEYKNKLIEYITTIGSNESIVFNIVKKNDHYYLYE